MSKHTATVPEPTTAELLSSDPSLCRAVVDSLADGIAIHDHDGSVIHTNRAAEDIFGLEVEKMRGEHALTLGWELFREDGSPLPNSEIPSEITRLTGNPCRNHTVQVRRTGRPVTWLSVSTDPIDTDSAQPPRVVATFTDITREREALSAVQKNRDRLRQIIETVPGVIIELFVDDASNTEVTFVSEDATEVLGIESTDLLGQPERFWSSVHVDDRAALEEIWQKPTRETIQREIRYQRGEDQRRLKVRASPAAPAPHGSVIHLLVFDVTTEYQLANELYSRQRQEGLGVLAAGVAHNFNNMLTVITATLHSALQQGDPELEPSLRDALTASAHATDLVQKLMNLARERRGSEEASLVDLVEVVSHVVDLCRESIGRTTPLDVELGVDTLPIRIHESEIQQVLLNLLINAEHATRGVEAPRIGVKLDVNGEWARIDVVDNGEGFGAEVSQRLGEPFFTTKSTNEGTGLGLASALAIVGELDGRLSWDSTPGAGARFTVELPLNAR